MNQKATIRRVDLLRRLFGCCTLFGLAVLAMAASSPQCARTQDTPLGVSSGLGLNDEASDCQESCANAANEARRTERDRFVEAIKNCQDADCRQEEALFHASIIQEIAADQVGCNGSCHNQGEGSGGN